MNQREVNLFPKDQVGTNGNVRVAMLSKIGDNAHSQDVMTDEYVEEVPKEKFGLEYALYMWKQRRK